MCPSVDTPESRRCYLAVDLGMSGCKTAVVTLDGRALGFAFRAVEALMLDGGGAEQRPADWWRAQLDSAALEITKPTGTYDPLRMANTSTNFTTYKPVVPITWQPTDRTEVSAKFSYSFNQTNKDTDYKSGRYAHVDYSLSYEAVDNLHVGVNGYFLKQVSDDRMAGVDVGNRGKAAAIGPAPDLPEIRQRGTALGIRNSASETARKAPMSGPS